MLCKKVIILYTVTDYLQLLLNLDNLFYILWIIWWENHHNFISPLIFNSQRNFRQDPVKILYNENKSNSRIEMIFFPFSATLLTFCWHLNQHFDIIKVSSRTLCFFVMSDQHIKKLMFLSMNPIFCSFCPNMYWKPFHCPFNIFFLNLTLFYFRKNNGS